jgi:cell division protein ZipA
MDANELRLLLIVVGVAILGIVYWLGRRKTPKDAAVPLPRFSTERTEPSFGGEAGQIDTQEQLEDLGPELEPAPDVVRQPDPPVHMSKSFEKVITLHVMADDGGVINGEELFVAAEKASLVHHAGLFHRLLDAAKESQPIFSVINRVQPGFFDVSNLAQVKTPGVSLFMTLPGPISALEAWERMLPAAQRLAELLKAQVYDSDMNTLGRQRIASIRDELRAYDRKQDRREIRPRW